MDIQAFLAIGIIGVIMSLVIEFIKKKFSSKPLVTKGITVALAVVLGTVYYFLSTTVYFASVLGILGVASTVYAFFLKKSK